MLHFLKNDHKRRVSDVAKNVEKLQQLILGYHENEEIEPRLQYDENST